MMDFGKSLPRRSWLRITRITLAVTLFSISASVIICSTFMDLFSAGLNVQGFLIATAMPVILGTPMIALFMIKTEQLRQANIQLHHIATRDALTGCLSRGAFSTEVEDHLRHAESRGALLVIDADHFKAINDNFGHDQGDETLRHIARAIGSPLTGGDIAGRLGGEEFGVYLPGADAAAAGRIAGQIRSQVNAIALDAMAGHPITVSIGVSTHLGPLPFRVLYRLADDLLYRAKDRGRDQIALPAAA